MKDIPTADLEKAKKFDRHGSTGAGKGGKRGKQSQTDIVDQCLKAYEEDKRPRRLGRMYAFWYNGNNEPRIVVGPDFWFSALEMAMANVIVGLILSSAARQGLLPLFYGGLAILLIHNGAFLTTVLRN